MKRLTKEEVQNFLNEQKEYGLKAASELGQRIIDRAIWCEEKGRELPFLIAKFETLKYKVQLYYLGRLGENMEFTLVDLHSLEGGAHGYPKLFFGDKNAFTMELVRELGYIDSLHTPRA